MNILSTPIAKIKKGATSELIMVISTILKLQKPKKLVKPTLAIILNIIIKIPLIPTKTLPMPTLI